MNKQEFLEEVGRLAERLFPEPLLVVRSRDWWRAELQKDKLSSERLESNREVIQHWVDGGDVWCEGTLVSSPTPCFESPRRTFSLTDPSLPKPKKYRPWTWADRGLVPDEVGYIQGPQYGRRRVVGISVDGLTIDGPLSRTWNDLFLHYTQPDGSPCGVEVSE